MKSLGALLLIFQVSAPPQRVQQQVSAEKLFARYGQCVNANADLADQNQAQAEEIARLRQQISDLLQQQSGKELR